MKTSRINSLDDLMGGAVTERFNHELERVLANVFDENTDPTAKRTITLTFTMVPTESRDMMAWKAQVTSKLAPYTPVTQMTLIHQHDDGNVEATQITSQVPGQIDMDGNMQQPPRVISFHAAASDE